MKRVGYIYDKLYDKEFIKSVIIKASKHKMKRKQVRKVIGNIDFYVDDLYNMIHENRIELKPTHQRTIREREKKRLITISPFYPNQCLDYLLVELLNPVIRKSMYKYCVGNVDKRGIVFGKKYIERNIKKYKYFLKLDIHHFYQSVNTKTLLKLLEHKIKDKKLIDFASKIINKDELPIGCYYSQWLSNFYLCEFDHYVKEVLLTPLYVRYVDDKLLMSNNKKKLLFAQYKIKSYLQSLDLDLKRTEIVYSTYEHNISFLGFLFNPFETKLRHKLFYRIQRTVSKLKEHFNNALIKRLIAFMGWLKQLKTGYTYYKNHIKDTIKIGYAKYKVSLIAN